MPRGTPLIRTNQNDSPTISWFTKPHSLRILPDMLQHPLWFIVWPVLHVLTFLTITLHCLRRCRNTSSTLLWISLAWAFPVLGPLLYLSFGVDRVQDRGFQKFLTNEALLKARQKNSQAAPRAFWHDFIAAPPTNEFQRELNRTFDA